MTRECGISLEGMMLKLKLQYFGHLTRRVDSLEKTVMLGGIGGRRRRGRQRMRWLDGITDSMDALCLTKSSACGRLWQFAHPRPLSLLQRGLAPRSKGMRWPKYWSFSFSISPSKAIPGLISFRMHWLDLLAVHRLSHKGSPRILEWVAHPFSRGSSQSRDQTQARV